MLFSRLLGTQRRVLDAALREVVNKQDKLSVIRLGYVGLPIATAFARKLVVIGYDANPARLICRKGVDPTAEVA